MGLFDSIAGQVAGAISKQGGSQLPGLMEAVMGLISNPQTGGLQGLIASFKSNGLGSIIESWIGKGENLPISGEQIGAALGNEQVQAIAKKLGLSTQDASKQLANFLPQAIDKLSPAGSLPQGEALKNAMGMLGGLFK